MIIKHENETSDEEEYSDDEDVMPETKNKESVNENTDEEDVSENDDNNDEIPDANDKENEEEEDDEEENEENEDDEDDEEDEEDEEDDGNILVPLVEVQNKAAKPKSKGAIPKIKSKPETEKVKKIAAAAETETETVSANSSPSSNNKTKKPMKELIEEAVRALNERKGSSFLAIKKYVMTNYQGSLLPKNLSFHMKKNLKLIVSNGTLVQTKGIGANGSFKLSNNAKDKEKNLLKQKMKQKKEKEMEHARKEKAKLKEEKKAEKKKGETTKAKATAMGTTKATAKAMKKNDASPKKPKQMKKVPKVQATDETPTTSKIAKKPTAKQKKQIDDGSTEKPAIAKAGRRKLVRKSIGSLIVPPPNAKVKKITKGAAALVVKAKKTDGQTKKRSAA